MLFNSFPFLFGFLPAVLAGAFLLDAMGARRFILGWMVATSLFFYGWWNPPFLILLVASVLGNFAVGRAIVRAQTMGRFRYGWWLTAAGVAGNLGAIGWFKYAGFLAANIPGLGGDFVVTQIILPLGISFFTFQQIAFLVDCRQGATKPHTLGEYALFVTFFPQLIAGPIVHHGDMLPQFQDPAAFRLRAASLAFGFEIFLIGLFKKTVLADGLAVYVQPVFGAAALGEPLTMVEAWGGALAFTFQLYFDFSGYSDMAVGLAAMFGLGLPVNFNSPYKATSIIDFWRRWHMTLSAFLRDYLYVPLGGNRWGRVRRFGNVLITMVLGGLWHGAAWTFVFWGFLHGVLLVLNHLWRALGLRLPRPLAWGLTFLAVTVGWVFFRADTFDAATGMVWTMFAGEGFALPLGYAEPLGWLGVAFTPMPYFEGAGQVAALSFALAWVIFAPNTQQWVAGVHGRPVGLTIDAPPVRYEWAAGRVGAVALGLLGGFAVIRLFLGGYSEFLYFQF